MAGPTRRRGGFGQPISLEDLEPEQLEKERDLPGERCPSGDEQAHLTAELLVERVGHFAEDKPASEREAQRGIRAVLILSVHVLIEELEGPAKQLALHSRGGGAGGEHVVVDLFEHPRDRGQNGGPRFDQVGHQLVDRFGEDHPKAGAEPAGLHHLRKRVRQRQEEHHRVVRLHQMELGNPPRLVAPVAMGEDDALRVPGRPRGVDEASRVIGPDLRDPRFECSPGRVLRRLALPDQVGERDFARGRGGAVEDHHSAYRGTIVQSLAESRKPSHLLAIRLVAVDENEDRFGVVQDVPALFGRVRGVDRNGDRPGRRNREIANHPSPPVRRAEFLPPPGRRRPSSLDPGWRTRSRPPSVRRAFGLPPGSSDPLPGA